MYSIWKELEAIGALDDDPEHLALTLTAGRGWYGSKVEESSAHVRHFNFIRSWFEDKRQKLLEDQMRRSDEVDDIDMFVDATVRACMNRRFFKTEGDELGLGPSILEPGDVLCVLFGAQMPFILRPTDHGVYHLAGEYYVHSLMDGRAIDEWKKSGIAAEDFSIV